MRSPQSFAMDQILLNRAKNRHRECRTSIFDSWATDHCYRTKHGNIKYFLNIIKRTNLVTLNSLPWHAAVAAQLHVHLSAHFYLLRPEKDGLLRLCRLVGGESLKGGMMSVLEYDPLVEQVILAVNWG